MSPDPSSAGGPVRTWVREVDEKLVLTWQVETADGWQKGGERPLTRRERLEWRVKATVPKP